MSRFWAGDPVFSRIARWTANLSFTLSVANEWKELTLTLPELRRTKTKTKRPHCGLTEAPRSDVRKALVTMCQVGLCGP